METLELRGEGFYIFRKLFGKILREIALSHWSLKTARRIIRKATGQFDLLCF